MKAWKRRSNFISKKIVYFNRISAFCGYSVRNSIEKFVKREYRDSRDWKKVRKFKKLRWQGGGTIRRRTGSISVESYSKLLYVLIYNAGKLGM